MNYVTVSGPPPQPFPSTPIALCSASDVLSLLSPITNTYAVSASFVAQSIASAQKDLERRCNTTFTPKRKVQVIDGTGTSGIVLPTGPMLSMYQCQVYNAYYVLLYTYYEHSFVINREAGILDFPYTANYNALTPTLNIFNEQTANTKVDYTTGHVEWAYQEVLTPQANGSWPNYYAFANPAVTQAISTVPQFGYSQSSPVPQYAPTVSVNGSPVATDYVAWADMHLAQAYQLVSNPITYTLVPNATAGGYSGISFTSSQGNAVITADYPYYVIPGDIAQACVKQAAITILTSIATSPYGDLTTGGMTQIVAEDFRTTANDRGQFGPQIAQWESEVATIVASYKRPLIPFGIGYSDAAQTSRWW